MKILILDTNWRAVSSLVYHYNKLGHEVFYVKPGSTSLIEWDKTLLWPILLSWSSENPSQTNFHYHDFHKLGELPYGEDNFLFLEDFVEPITEKSCTVKLVDIEKENNFFDAVHITPHFHKERLQGVLSLIEKYCKGSKIINSTFDPGNFRERMSWFSNSCEFLPACYEGLSPKAGIKNHVGFYRHSNEIKILGVDPAENQNLWSDNLTFSSFHHNFKVRQPENTIKVQEALNSALSTYGGTLENFGGNIRRQGADIRYSGENGITGNYKTLSPREVLKQYFKSRGVIHLKSDDWAGGVPSACRSTGTPIIVHRNYILGTKFKSAWGEQKDSNHYFDVFTASDIWDAVSYLSNDSNCKNSREKVLELEKSIFSEDYWSSWRDFLKNLE